MIDCVNLRASIFDMVNFTSAEEPDILVSKNNIGMIVRGNSLVVQNPQIIVYTLENCPNCEILKEYLEREGAAYGIRNMMDPAALTELRLNGVFVREAPVLQKGKKFLTSTDIFENGTVIDGMVAPLITGDE
jgi:glutaredoxin